MSSRTKMPGGECFSRRLWLLALVPIPLICYFAVWLDVATYAAVILLIASTLVLIGVQHRNQSSAATLISAFFLVATCHVLIGYALAGPSSMLIWIGTSAGRDYARAFLLISAGLVSAIVAYAVAGANTGGRIRELCRRFEFTDKKLFTIARLLIVPGALLVALVYARIGLIPLLADSPGRARYFNYQLSSDYLLDEWLVSRALDLLTFALPLVVASALWRKKWLDLLLSVVGMAALLVPLRRANLMSAFFVLLVMHTLRTGRAQLKHAVVVLLLIGGYAISQFVFINIISAGEFETDAGVAVAGSALPEVRDLGWTLGLMHDERLYGTTFLQSLVPVPSLLSNFSQTHSLRAVTSRLIGLEAERSTGGLRLTLAGEAYLNFGYFGPVILGALFGFACGWLNAAMSALAERRAMWALYAAAVFFVWLCFWLYLGGTQAAATIKIGSGLLLLSLYLSRAPRSRELDPAEGVA